VHPRGLLAIVKLVRNDLLAVPVREEIYRPRWYDTNECWSETLEQGARRFFLVDVPEVAVSTA
jgi:hypothetical protein